MAYHVIDGSKYYELRDEIQENNNKSLIRLKSFTIGIKINGIECCDE